MTRKEVPSQIRLIEVPIGTPIHKPLTFQEIQSIMIAYIKNMDLKSKDELVSCQINVR